MTLRFLRGFPLAAVAALALMFTRAWAQTAGPRLTIAGTDGSAFPRVTAYLLVRDADNAPIAGLNSANFSILEDGAAIPAAALTVEGTSPLPSSIVLAFDTSTDENALGTMKASALFLLDSMTDKDRVGVVRFFDEVVTAQELTGDRALITAAINGLPAGGASTSLYAGALAAVQAASTAEGRRAVLLLTDSADFTGAATLQQVIGQARNAGVSIYPIGFGAKVDPDALTRMADETGGQASILPDAAGIANSLFTAWNRARQGYTISYQSSLEADNAEHALTVILTYQGQEVRVQDSFVAVPNPTLTFSVTNGQTVAGVINLTAVAAGPQPIASVEYLLDGATLATLVAAPYTYQWDSKTASPGTHTLTARAVDSAGHMAETQATIHVLEVTPLTVSASSARSVRAGESLAVEASVLATTPVTKVDFLLDGELIESDLSAPYTLSLDTAEVTPGFHMISVVAEDSLGQTAQTDISVRVQAKPFSLGEFAARYKRLAIDLIVVVAMLVVAGLALLLLGAVSRAKRGRSARTCRVEITNTGNARSRYQLRADDPLSALKFQFTLNGVDLMPQPQAAYAAPGRPMSAPAPQPAPSPNKPSGGGGWALSTAIADLFSTVGYLLPGSAGSSAMQAGLGVRQAQYTTGRVQSIGEQAGAVRSASGQVPQPPPMSVQDAAARHAPPPATMPAGQAAYYGPPAAAPVVPVPSQAQTARPIPAVGPLWAETPALDPGESLTVQLTIDRIKPGGVKRYAFRVHSKSMEGGGPPVVEHASIELGRLPLWLSMMPILIVLAALGVELVLMAVLLTPAAGWLG